VSDPALNEKKGFVVDKLAGANDGGLVAPPCACVPVFPVAPAVDCPRFVELGSSLSLKPDEAGIIPLAGVPADLPSLIPNTDDWVACAVVVLEAGGLLNGFVIGCTVGADGFFNVPKLNMGFGGAPDGVAAARALDGVTLVGLLVIPKLNFGFDASLAPPAGTALALGLELFSVEVGGLGFCPSEKIP